MNKKNTQTMKNLFAIIVLTGMLLSGGCEVLDNFDEAEPCEKMVRSNIPTFTSQDLSPCSDIKSVEFKEESISEDSRYLSYDIIDVSDSKFPEYLEAAEFATCENANIYYDLLKASSDDLENENLKTPSTLSKLFDEAHLIYQVDDESLREIVGRIDNIVLRLGFDFLDCSHDWDSSLELFNNIGARVIK